MSKAESEASVPLLVEDEKAVGVQECKRSSFLFQRLTYYWIVFVSQALQVGLTTLAAVVASKEKTTESGNGEEVGRFAGSAIYSFLTMLWIGLLLVAHHKKRPDTGPKKFTAGGHVKLARACATMSIINLLLLFGPLAIRYARGDGSNDIRSVVVPVDISLFLISAIASTISARITYTAAKRARGIEQVPDPDYRVPAWTLATTSESQGFTAGNAVQLA